ncbi:hypothetical protein NC652_033668 [Populus alba x Populus x berolinensis]|nr:hypothetical protein NC652_033668 [Populus alba x Populus x berolinensis]
MNYKLGDQSPIPYPSLPGNKPQGLKIFGFHGVYAIKVHMDNRCNTKFSIAFYQNIFIATYMCHLLTPL